MTDEAFPQAISPDELSAGFQRLLIDGVGDPTASKMRPVVPIPVVAKILDSSDVLVKIYDLRDRKKVAYSHRRWGRNQHDTELDHRSWYAIHSPIPDANLVIDNYKTGRVKGMYEDEIVGFRFRYRVA
jgi:hypothetical protein